MTLQECSWDIKFNKSVLYQQGLKIIKDMMKQIVVFQKRHKLSILRLNNIKNQHV